MWLFVGEQNDEFIKIGDASTTKKIEKLFIALTWLYGVEKIFSLRFRYTSSSNKFIDKVVFTDDGVHQHRNIDSQLAYQIFT